MSISHRMKVKYFVEEPKAIDLSAFIPLFHGWIQEQPGDDLLIDVADYKHVPQGPGILLMGHEADYALDMSNDRPGLMYIRKRQGIATQQPADLSARLQQMLRQVLEGCQSTESATHFETPIRFRTDEIELTFPDRLNTPNQAEQYALLQSEIQPIIESIYGDTPIQIEQANRDHRDDPRRALTLRINASGAPNISTLLERLP